MLKTFKAWLKGSSLEWIGDGPDALGEQMLQVHAAFLADKPVLGIKNTRAKDGRHPSKSCCHPIGGC